MKTSICTICKLEKSTSEFYSSNYNKKGHHSACRMCYGEAERKRRTPEKSRAHYLKHRDKALARQKAYSIKNKDKIRATTKDYYERHPDRWMEAGWKQKGIKTKSGEYFKVKNYQEELAKTDNKCSICNRSETFKNKRLAVDHDHTTGVYRGILCGKCNVALSYFQDNPEILNKAIEYLKQTKNGGGSIPVSR